MIRFNKQIIEKLRIFIQQSKQVPVLNQSLKLILSKLYPQAQKVRRNITVNDITNIYRRSRGQQKLLFQKLNKKYKKLNIFSIANLLIQRNHNFKRLIHDQIRLLKSLKSGKLRFQNYLKSLGLSARHIRYIKRQTTRGYYALVTRGWKNVHQSNFTKVKKRLDGVIVYLSVNDQTNEQITQGKF